MKLYVDENLPRHLAEGFDILQRPEGLRSGFNMEVEYIPSVFERGTKDIDWLPNLEPGACVLTQDVNIHRQKHERELYRKYEIGIFFLKGSSSKKGLSVWEMVQALAKNWIEISRFAHEGRRPFEYRVTLSRGVNASSRNLLFFSPSERHSPHVEPAPVDHQPQLPLPGGKDQPRYRHRLPHLIAPRSRHRH